MSPQSRGYSFRVREPLPLNQLNCLPGRIAVVLGSGGYTGAFQPKVLKLLGVHNIPITKVIGVSVGAINGGSFVANGTADELIDVWSSIRKPSDVFELQPKLYFIRKLGMPESVYRYEPLARLVGRIHEERLVRSAMEFIAVATRVYPELRTLQERLNNGKVAYFSTKDPEMVAYPKKMLLAVLASCSFPTGFPPVPLEYRGEKGWYVDGAFKRLFPLLKALEDGCNTIIAVRCRSNRTRGPYPKNWLERTAYSLDLLHDKDEKDEVQLVRLLSFFSRYLKTEIDESSEDFQKIRALSDRLKNINLFLVEPEQLPDTLNTVSFKRGDLHRAMDEGERVASEVLAPLISHYRPRPGGEQGGSGPGGA